MTKLFTTLCKLLGSGRVTTTTSHPQTSIQAERFNKTILTQLRNYIPEYQHNWDRFVQPHTNTFSTQVNRSTNTTLYSLVLAQQPPVLKVLYASSTVPTNAHGEPSTQSLRQQLEIRMQAIRTRTDAHLQEPQKQCESDYDRCVCKISTFHPGDLVFIDRLSLSKMKSGIADNIVTAAYNRLMPRSLGLFCNITTSSHFLVIDEYGAHSIVSADRATHVSHLTSLNTDKTLTRPSRQSVRKKTVPGKVK